MELFTKIINSSKSLTFSAKSSILNILLGPENASGFTVFNYFHQKPHLRPLRELICLCIYLVRQFWRWINKIRKVCYEETQNNCNKYVVSENSCSKNFVHFQEKHLSEIAFLNKVAGMFFWEIYKIFTKNNREWWLLQLVIIGKCYDQNIFFKNYLIQFV